MAFSKSKSVQPVGTYGKKAFIRSPEPNISITPGGINLSSPVVQAPVEEDPADVVLKSLASGKLAGEAHRTKGFKYKELDLNTAKAFMDKIDSLYKIKKLYKEFKDKKYPTGQLQGRVPLVIKEYTDPQEAAYWEAGLKQALSQYLHEQTGAARGFQEMSWYAPTFPERTNPPDVIDSKFRRNIEGMEASINHNLDIMAAYGVNPDQLAKLKKIAYLGFVKGAK